MDRCGTCRYWDQDRWEVSPAERQAYYPNPLPDGVQIGVCRRISEEFLSGSLTASPVAIASSLSQETGTLTTQAVFGCALYEVRFVV